MIKILIADDHAIVREGLKKIIAQTSDIIVEDEATNGAGVISKVLKNDYDVIVLDITMPGRDGIDVMKQIKTIKPKIEILILSMHSEDQFAIRALKAGASGYLTKDSAPDELVDAIRRISLGRKHITSSLADKLAFEIGTDYEKLPHEKLSDREYQVLVLMASGKAVKEIAEELFISSNTVSTYRARILAKMGMRTNAELTSYAVKNQLVD